MRTCVGCRERAATTDLVRVVAGSGGASVVPDPQRRMPGRGASLHPDLDCLELAERRRSFARALRLAGPVDTVAVRRHVEQQVQDRQHVQDKTRVSPGAGPDRKRVEKR